MYYFEYPALASMLLREIRYGVELTLDAITVDPFGAPAAFQYHTGDVNVVMDPAGRSTISVPGTGLSPYVLKAMQPSATYQVSSTPGCATPWTAVTVQADTDGVVSFTAPRGTDCTIAVSKQ